MSQTRRFIQPFQVAENWTMLTSTSSAAIDISNVDDISIVYFWTGTTPVGTLFVQVRNGENCPWTNLDIAPPAAIATNSGSNNIQITNVSFQEMRVTYTASSGNGTLNAWLTGKGR